VFFEHYLAAYNFSSMIHVVNPEAPWPVVVSYDIVRQGI